ncbi:MAG: MBL fold metallo-hydrolase [Spirochaetota bacterium]
MKIKILGNGGYVNKGLPYNSFIINSKLLVECPPDIMVSLHREKVNLPLIEEIFISHLHGDHCFGFPFFVYHFYHNEINVKFRLFSVKEAKEHLIDLTEKALSAGNPCIDWINKNIEFVNISDNPEISLLNYKARLFRMDHSRENYGFVLYDNGRSSLSYISDTKWSENIEAMLKENPKAVLVDLAGEPEDKNPVHLSEKEIIAKGIKLVSKETIFYGTHLIHKKKSSHHRIKYVKPGMKIKI